MNGSTSRYPWIFEILSWSLETPTAESSSFTISHAAGSRDQAFGNEQLRFLVAPPKHLTNMRPSFAPQGARTIARTFSGLLRHRPVPRLQNGYTYAKLGAARWYSPVRSRVPQPPRPQLQKRNNLADRDLEMMNGEQAASHLGTPRSPVPTIGIPPVLANLLQEPTLIFERHFEMMNVVLGFEQVNRYTIYNPAGQVLGFMEEDDMSFFKAMTRQIYRLHRPFTVNVFDSSGQHAMTIRRPFSFINSHIKCLLPGADANDASAVIGESRQEWHLWRRRYNLYLNNAATETMTQFGRVDAPFLSFSFPVQNESGQILGAIDRNWVGLAREVFTDTGVYVVRMSPDSLMEGSYQTPDSPPPPELSLEQRAVMLATAVSVDFDYFSRHSSRGVGISDVE